MKTAFKEWAAVCRSLSRGAATVILRRGGISEKGGRFQPEFSEFFLFPTRFHQSPEDVAPSARPDLDAANAAAPPEGFLVLTSFARVAAILPVRDKPALARLRPFHPWSDAAALERLRREGPDPLFALAVRVFNLPAPVTLPMRPAYGGCKSWVTLEADVSISGAVPALGEPEFARLLARIREV
ncbi:MAG: DUF1802 family protein [Planctomycetes bacterium]|nr:DUF1802 family protein [Planctomycetota bacterium]